MAVDDPPPHRHLVSGKRYWVDKRRGVEGRNENQFCKTLGVGERYTCIRPDILTTSSCMAWRVRWPGGGDSRSRRHSRPHATTCGGMLCWGMPPLEPYRTLVAMVPKRSFRNLAPEEQVERLQRRAAELQERADFRSAMKFLAQHPAVFEPSSVGTYIVLRDDGTHAFGLCAQAHSVLALARRYMFYPPSRAQVRTLCAYLSFRCIFYLLARW